VPLAEKYRVGNGTAAPSPDCTGVYSLRPGETSIYDGPAGSNATLAWLDIPGGGHWVLYYPCGTGGSYSWTGGTDPDDPRGTYSYVIGEPECTASGYPAVEDVSLARLWYPWCCAPCPPGVVSTFDCLYIACETNCQDLDGYYYWFGTAGGQRAYVSQSYSGPRPVGIVQYNEGSGRWRIIESASGEYAEQVAAPDPTESPLGVYAGGTLTPEATFTAARSTCPPITCLDNCVDGESPFQFAVTVSGVTGDAYFLERNNSDILSGVPTGGCVWNGTVVMQPLTAWDRAHCSDSKWKVTVSYDATRSKYVLKLAEDATCDDINPGPYVYWEYLSDTPIDCLAFDADLTLVSGDFSPDGSFFGSTAHLTAVPS
jgi:hypothetical protein